MLSFFVAVLAAASAVAAAPIQETGIQTRLASHGLRYVGSTPYSRFDERSWDRAGSRRLSAEAGAVRLKISSEADADEPAARRRLGEWRARFLGLFDGDAAYPGMVTRSVRTPPSLRPRPVDAPGRSVWLAPATERLTFGAGSEDLVRYRTVVSQRWCDHARRSVEVILFFPATTKDAELLAEEGRFLCLKDGPDEARVIQEAGLLMESGRTDEAVRALRRGLEGSPDSPALRISLAQALRDTGAVAEAAELFRQARDARPQSFAEYADRGYSRLIAGDFDAARTHMQAAVDADPSNAFFVHHLGAVYGRVERWSEALPYFEKARALWESQGVRSPHYYHTLYWLAETLHALGRDDESLALFQRILDELKGDGRMLRRLAARGKSNILSSRNRNGEAIRTLESVVAECERSGRSCPVLGIMLARSLLKDSKKESMRRARAAMEELDLASSPSRSTGTIEADTPPDNTILANAYSEAMLYFDAAGEDGLADAASSKADRLLRSNPAVDMDTAEVCRRVGAHMEKRGDTSGAEYHFCRIADIYHRFGHLVREKSMRTKCGRKAP